MRSIGHVFWRKFKFSSRVERRLFLKCYRLVIFTNNFYSTMPSEPGVNGTLQVKKLSEHATIPTKGSSHAAGFDLYSAYDYVIPPMEKELIKTDIQIKIPDGCYGRIAPRSGLAHKSFIDVGAGVVDQDYRGNVGVILFNFGKTEFQVRKGDRIAQLICEKISYPKVEEVQHLDETNRGGSGFGSTGKC